MATINFEQRRILTNEQAERLAEILCEEPSRQISDEEITKTKADFERGDKLLEQFDFVSKH